ncbi:hypothetical protein ALC56_14172 [Trachymyrmex septentrionalis]|uniref:Uncharacterized protein n=1 Tax=Trachymyrmex septentrionalis TaxID=34720 RepID=A0A195ET06_9HYME|nr:hypothetical protein ALC56_14172 [Trachymyrmex septentrionalis]
MQGQNINIFNEACPWDLRALVGASERARGRGEAQFLGIFTTSSWRSDISFSFPFVPQLSIRQLRQPGALGQSARRHNYVVIDYKYQAGKLLRHNEEAMPQQGRDEQKSKRPFPQWPLTLHDCVRPSQSRLVELVRAQAPPRLYHTGISQISEELGRVTTLEMAPPSFSAGHS